MSLRHDVKNLNNPEADNFHVQLLRLMMKADPSNRARLERAFPNTAKMLRLWQESPTGNEELPDIPYD